MELNEAIEALKNSWCMTTNHVLDDKNKKLKQAIQMIITTVTEQKSVIKYLEQSSKDAIRDFVKAKEELNTSYNKGYQDGFQSVRYDKYVNDMYGEEDTASKYLAIQREGYKQGYQDGFEQAKFNDGMNKWEGK